jgi:hypothetical protein
MTWARATTQKIPCFLEGVSKFLCIHIQCPLWKYNFGRIFKITYWYLLVGWYFGQYFVELFSDLVFLVGIGWYFLGILPTDTEGKLGWYISVSKKWQEPLFPSKKGSFGPLLEHSAPLLREKGFPAVKKKMFPETSK